MKKDSRSVTSQVTYLALCSFSETQRYSAKLSEIRDFKENPLMVASVWWVAICDLQMMRTNLFLRSLEALFSALRFWDEPGGSPKLFSVQRATETEAELHPNRNSGVYFLKPNV